MKIRTNLQLFLSKKLLQFCVYTQIEPGMQPITWKSRINRKGFQIEATNRVQYGRI